VHIQTPFIAHYAGVKLAKKLNIPRVATYHTYFEEYLYHYVPYLPRAWMKYIARRFTRSQCKDLDALVVPSSAMLNVLRDYGVLTHAQVIPTGLELNQFEHNKNLSFRARYEIPEQRPIMLFIGRVAHEKNIDFLLHVTARVRQAIPDVLLIVAGEGPALPHLKQAVRQLNLETNVLFVGYLDRETTLLDCYSSANLFVFASKTETQGLVLLEAMALGVPVVSTAVMGTKDILAPQKGALVAQEDVGDFADKVKMVLTNNNLQEHLSNEARQYVHSWSARTMALKLSEFYQNVISERLSQAA
jgi:glycosyltransferase involved in cell wall biosynthesis